MCCVNPSIMPANVIALKYRHVTGPHGPDKTQSSHCMTDNCKTDRVLRACSYVHLIITDGVLLCEVNKVSHKMFSLDWRVRQRLESGKGAEFPIRQCWGMSMAQSGLKLDVQCLLVFLWTGFWWLVVVEWVVGNICFVACLSESVLFIMSRDEEEVLL